MKNSKNNSWLKNDLINQKRSFISFSQKQSIPECISTLSSSHGMNSKKELKNLTKITLILLSFGFSLNLFGTDWSVYNGLSGTNNVQAGSTISIQDVHYPWIDNIGLTAYNEFYSNEMVRDVIELGVHDKFSGTLSSWPSYTLKVEYEVIPAVLFGYSAPSFTGELEVSYDRYGEVEDYKSAQVFYNIHKYELIITKIEVHDGNGHISNTLPTNAYIDCGIEIERYKWLDCNIVPSPNLTHYFIDSNGNYPINLSGNPTSTSTDMVLKWNYLAEAEYYELEWTYIDNYTDNYNQYEVASDIPFSDKDFNSNASRVVTNFTQYQIPLTFDHGFLIYRLRAIGYSGETIGSYNFLTAGKWTSDNINVHTMVSDWPNYFHIAHPHESNKNWQVVTTFAEEGKKKEVISYYDGLNRNRQVVTKINSLDEAVVAESVYDYHGRPAVSILPVPAGDTELKFYDEFNKSSFSGLPYASSDFDQDASTCVPASANSLDNSSGTGLYYGEINVLNNNYQDFTPNAFGYAFSQVQYTPDNTGRIKTQGGVGEHHQLDGKNTRYFYNKAEQYELDRLFGYEVGFASRYKKNLVVDPNGQVSVSYVDAHGRTVATALAGEAPENLEALSNLAAETEIEIDLMAAQNNIMWTANPTSSSYATTITPVSNGSSHNFTYEVEVPPFSNDCMTGFEAFNVVFDLEYDLTNDCAVSVPGFNTYSGSVGVSNYDPVTYDANGNWQNLVNGIPVGNSYENPPPSTVQLDIDNYHLSRSLLLDEDVMDKYALHYAHMALENCVTEDDDFLQMQIDNLLANNDCDYDCQSCLDDAQAGLDDNLYTQAQYDLLIEECEELCSQDAFNLCDLSEELMLSDISPGGQYGQTDGSEFYSIFTGHVNFTHPEAWKIPDHPYVNLDGTTAFIEIFPNGGNFMPDVTTATNILTNQTAATAVDLQLLLIAEMIDGANGTVYDIVEVDGIYYTLPENLLDLNVYLDEWETTWAKSLLPYHPEYCYLQECRAYELKEVKDFRGTPQNVFSFETMLGQLHEGSSEFAGGIKAFAQSMVLIDPVFTASSNCWTNNYLDQFSDYVDLVLNESLGNGVNSLIEFAAFTNDCGNWYGDDIVNCTVAFDSFEDWQVFAGIYIGLRQKWIKESILQCANNCLPNNQCINFDGNTTQASLDCIGHYGGYPGVTEIYDKQRRFWLEDATIVDAGSTVNQAQQLSNQANYNLYDETGLCPTAFQFYHFLEAMLQDDVLGYGTINYPLLNQASFTYLLYHQLTGISYDPVSQTYAGNADYSHPKWTESLNLNGDILTIEISDDIWNSIAIELDAGIGSDWNNLAPDLSTFQQLQVDANNSNEFDLLGVRLGGSQIVIHGTITSASGIDLEDCEAWLDPPATSGDPFAGGFYQECEMSEMGEDLIAILNLLHDGANLNSSNINSSYYDFDNTYEEGFLSNLSLINFLGVDVTTAAWTNSNSANGDYELSDANGNGFTISSSPNLQPLNYTDQFVSVINFGNTVSQYTLTIMDDNGDFVDQVNTIELLQNTAVFALPSPFNNCGFPGECNPMGNTPLLSDLADFVLHVSQSVNAGIMPLNVNLQDYQMLYSELLDNNPYTLPVFGQVIQGAVIYDPSTIDMNQPFTIQIFDGTYPNDQVLLCNLEVHVKRDGNGLIGSGLGLSTPIIELPEPQDANYDVSFTYYVAGVNIGDGAEILVAHCFDDCTECESVDIPMVSCNAAFDEYMTGLDTYDYFGINVGDPFISNEIGSSTINDPNEDPDAAYIFTSETDFCDYGIGGYVSYYLDYLAELASPSLPYGFNHEVKSILDPFYVSLDEFAAGNYHMHTGLVTIPNVSTASYLDFLAALEDYILPQPISDYNTQAEFDDLYNNIHFLTLADFVEGGYSFECLGQVDDGFGNPTGYIEHLIDNGINADPIDQFCSGMDLGPDFCNNYPTVFPDVDFPSVNDCEAYANFIAQSNTTNFIQTLINDLSGDFKQQYRAHFQNSVLESLLHNRTDQEYHHTLYYYDLAGNLIKTTPPAGVEVMQPAEYDVVNDDRLANNPFPTNITEHFLSTHYQYNTLNQLMWQSTPDGGESNFWYDELGRLVCSQNAKQLDFEEYSYTLYDDLGRIHEVGQITVRGYLIASPLDLITHQVDYADFVDWIDYSGTVKDQVAYTYYNEHTGSMVFNSGYPQYIRNRVASVSYSEDGDEINYDNASHYSYDVHGNVKELIQEFTELSGLEQDAKHIEYSYDLISGNVHEVNYQEGAADQFNHRYTYDADNRILSTETSNDGIFWERDAYYQYYKHGPLARMETGDDVVQGSDYAYTVQGWLKGVNSNFNEAENDMGKDGFSDVLNSNRYVPKDECGYSLGYFENDYVSVSDDIPAAKQWLIERNTDPIFTDNTLHNGNISHMVTAIKHFMDDPLVDNGSPVLMAYTYDQLNRIKSATKRTGTALNVNNRIAWDPAPINAPLSDYYSDYTYDPNGNLLNLTRNGFKGQGPASDREMDELEYDYDTGVNNRLRSVNDTKSNVMVGTDRKYDDLDEGPRDYGYDAIGNLTEDSEEEIAEIKWTVTGKVSEIIRTAGSTSPNLEFQYDASGNRVLKIVKPTSQFYDWDYTYYVRDAQGNVMATYEKSYEELPGLVFVEKNAVKEQHIYGSSRVGYVQMAVDLASRELTYVVDQNAEFGLALASASPTVTATAPDIDFTLLKGDKRYEFSNHLGNVLAITSDKITVAATDGSGMFAETYAASLMSAQNYYPFGMVMPNYSYVNDEGYRYGFNGMEEDSELKGSKNSYDFGARMYDPRVARWLNIDPYFAEYAPISPYVFALNSVISFKDADGNIVVGTDGDPVSYKRNGDGTITWSANASADTRRIGNAMLSTPKGTEMFNQMRDVTWNIRLTINTTDLLREDNTITLGQTYHTVGNSDKDHDVSVQPEFKKSSGVDVVIYEKSIKELMNLKQKFMGIEDLRLDELIAAVAGHEADHASGSDNEEKILTYMFFRKIFGEDDELTQSAYEAKEKGPHNIERIIAEQIDSQKPRYIEPRISLPSKSDIGERKPKGL